jgi:hypothetical protein
MRPATKDNLAMAGGMVGIAALVVAFAEWWHRRHRVGTPPTSGRDPLS